MLIKSLPLKELIEVPEFPGEIIKILPHRADPEKKTILYKMYLDINIDSAMALDALNMNVKVYKNKPAKSPIPSSVISAAVFSSLTKTLEKSVSTSKTTKDALVIANKEIDLTQYFSNDLANIAKGTKSKELSQTLYKTRQQINSMTSRIVRTQQTDPFTQSRQASYHPVPSGVQTSPGISLKKNTNEPLSTSVLQGVSVPAPVSTSFSKSLVAIKTDPASVTASSNMGFSKTFSSPLMTTNVANFVFTAPRSLPPLGIIKTAPQIMKIDFVISIDKSKLGNSSSFYVNFEIEDTRGNRVAQAETNISHARIYNTFITPSIAPNLEAEYIKPGVISVTVGIDKKYLGVRQPPSIFRTMKSLTNLPAPNAKNCKRIKVFRRVAPPQEGGTDIGTPWFEVLDVEVGENLESITARDQVLTSRPVIYRAICYGENFKPSEKFSSTVVLPLKEFKVSQTGSLTAVSSLSTKGDNSFVKVRVKDIPRDVIAVMVKRFNKTTSSDSGRKSSKNAGFVYVGRTIKDQQKLIPSTGMDDGLTFLDRTAKVGNNYSYVPVGITKTGKKIVGASSILEIPNSPTRAQVGINVRDPKISRVDNDPSSLVIELSGKFTEFGFSEIRKALGSAQQADLFSKDILEDRDKFESLINFLVERKNTKTGEVESFGTYNSGDFVDNAKIRTEKNIKGIEPGVEYVYTITALLSPPESLFPTLKRPEIDIATLIPFQRSVAKFRGPLAIAGSTLSSTSRQKDKSQPSAIEPIDPLIAGRTNVQVEKSFRFPVAKNGQPSIKLEKFMRFNRITWQYKDVANVDHFRIYVVSSGGKVLVDTVHCDATTSEFYYRHYSKDYAVGFKYMVQPVDLSYNELKPIMTKSLKPSALVLKAVLNSPIQSTSFTQLNDAFKNMMSIL